MRQGQASAFAPTVGLFHAVGGRIEISVMKRFTETTKWRDPWFRRLSQTSKLLWSWLTDNCDNAGVIDIDLESASFDIGKAVNEDHLLEVESRLHALPNGKVWIPSFIEFQYGAKLSEKCFPHAKVLELLVRHGIQYPEMLSKSTTLPPTLPPTLGLLYKRGRGRGKEEEGVQGEDQKPETIYDAYPRKVGRPAALIKISAAIAKHGYQHVLDKTKAYATARIGEDAAYTPHPATWFNQERYNDDPSTWKRSNGKITQPNSRNAGVVTGPTIYGAHIKPRAQREREEAARLAGQVAQAEEQSLIGVEGGGGGGL